MPRYIIKIKDKYFEWSTIVDAPVTYGMSLDEFRSYYRQEYGDSSMSTLDERLVRVENKGTSSMMHDSLKDCISYNRAGDNEKNISIKSIYSRYAMPQEATDAN